MKEVTIVRGSIRKDLVHMLNGYSQNITINKSVQYLNVRLSRLIQDEFSELKKKYRGNICGHKDIFLK